MPTHALVIGGSIAGLLAAHVLCNHFDRVTIVERDFLPAEPQPRKGTPHARHRHQLLMGGRLILEQLFPGIEADLLNAGATVVDWSGTIAPLTPVASGSYFGTNYNVHYYSRDLLEWSIRRRVLASPQIRCLQQQEVTSLLADESHTVVIGVQTRGRSQNAAAEESLYADLIIDAGGRYSRAPKWLEALGYTPPQETTVNSLVRYVSRYYTCPSDRTPDWQVMLTETASRGCVIARVEGNRWLATITGVAGDYPPLEEEPLLDFVRSLPSSQAYQFIDTAVPISPVWGYQHTENRLRHYESLSSRPEQFIVLGDAACILNPQHSQGITVAAQSAKVLDRCLHTYSQTTTHRDPAGFALYFQQELAKNNTAPWLLATNRDFRYRTTQGEKPQWSPLLHWYLDRLTMLAAHDAKAHGILFAVTQLLKPPGILFRPRLVAKVLQQHFGAGNR